MYKKAIIKGDAVDHIGKTVLIIGLAAIYLGGIVLPDMKANGVADWMKITLICISTVVLALLRDKVKSRVKCIPMIVFTAGRVPWILESMAHNRNILVIMIFAGMLILFILTCIEMMTIQDEIDGDYSVDKGDRIRYFLYVLLIMDVSFKLPYIVLDEDRWNAALLLSRCSILLASMILYLPRQGFLNIRRILITGGKCLVVSTVTYGAIKLAEKWTGAVYESDALAAIIAVVISGFTLLLCVDSKAEPVIAIDEYEYTFGEKLLRTIGWSNYAEEMANLNNYLESASKREFSYEYARRFYNDMRSAKDIEFIQQRIRTIQQELSLCPEDTSDQERIIKVYLEIEGAELLGKLSIAYDFKTGISSCSAETLNTDYEGWGQCQKEIVQQIMDITKK